VDNQLPQLGGILDLVLSLAEDQAEHPGLLAERFQRIAIVLFELDALHLRVREVLPEISLGDGLRFPGHHCALVGHLQEQQERELLQVVLITQAVVSQDLAVAPELLDDAFALVAHDAALSLRTRGSLTGAVADRSARIRARSASAGSSTGS